MERNKKIFLTKWKIFLSEKKSIDFSCGKNDISYDLKLIVYVVLISLSRIFLKNSCEIKNISDKMKIISY